MGKNPRQNAWNYFIPSKSYLALHCTTLHACTEPRYTTLRGTCTTSPARPTAAH
ncbi:hypothetical protein Mp_5g01270 [Marchantia polymorpha subsp. ruderalis]|uniref:Uncharacterized protein n=1 Tax=Marchantia polymorpha subsp. ruderalis TaxID=1480154 RepID=A0AAF6BDR3_MARPO|nr:hypothetical protein Mp_5g01270 [Marchantia polymorpha subsp. ruderalis]